MALFWLKARLVYDRTMKIITLNIAGRNNFGKNFQERIEAVAAFIDQEEPDLICFQEAAFSEHENIAEKINKMLKKPFAFSAAQMCEKYTFDKFSEGFAKKWQAGQVEHYDDYTNDGLAVLSRTPIVSNSTIVLKPVPTDDRGRPDYRVRIAQILKLDSGFTISNIHLASNNNSHLQLEELMNYAKTDAIVGDFNMFADNLYKHADVWKSDYQQSYDFQKYVSFPEENVALDYMLLKPEYEFVSVRTAENLSDHAAVVFELRKK